MSEADIAVDALLRERLLSIRDAGWLSEETEDDPARLRRDEVWVVDPIDGTRAYLAAAKNWDTETNSCARSGNSVRWHTGKIQRHY